MKKILLFSTILAFFAASAASAQTRPRYVFDNFDTASSVNVYTPPPVEVKAKPAARKSTAKSNAVNPRAGNSVQNTAVVRHSAEPTLRMAAGRTLGSFTTGDAKIDGYILDSAARHNIDPLLVYATMSQESAFKLKATSYKGARGLMQLMPATAARFGVTSIYDPQQNIEAGVKYLRWLMNTFNQDVRLTLAGYNAGEGAVMKYGNTIPPYRETQDYVAKITARYAQIRNPNYVRSLPRLPAANNSATDKNGKPVVVKSAPPTPTYEPSASAVRLPNGKIQLVTQ